MSKIDREKVLQWGRERLNQLKKKNDVMVTRDYVDGYIDAFEEWLRELQSGAFDVRETELENKLNQAVEALKTIMYLPSSHPYVRAIADNALQSIKGGESDE